MLGNFDVDIRLYYRIICSSSVAIKINEDINKTIKFHIYTYK